MHSQQKTHSDEKLKLAIKLITEQKALVKVIKSTLNDDTSWQFNFDSLNKPESFRPLAKLSATCDRTYIFNPVTGKEEKRDLSNKPRGKEKKTDLTKKTSVSLLPPNGRMVFFELKHPVGLIYNIDECRLNDKYIFSGNMATDSRWWIKGQPGYADAKKYPPTTIQAIRKQHADFTKQALSDTKIAPPNWNELLVKLRKKSVAAIFAPQDNLICRLNSLHKMYLAEEKLGMTLPLLIITPSTGFKAYTEQDQIEDIKNACSSLMSFELLIKLMEFEKFQKKFKEYTPYFTNPTNQFKLFLLAEDKKWDAAADLLAANVDTVPAAFFNRIVPHMFATLSNSDILDSKTGQAFLYHKNSGLFAEYVSRNLNVPEALLKKHLQSIDISQKSCVAIRLMILNSQRRVVNWLFTTFDISLNWSTTVTKNNILHLALMEEKPDLDLIKLILESKNSKLVVAHKNLAGELPIFTAIQKMHYEIIELWFTKYPLLLTSDDIEFIICNLIKFSNIALAKKLLRFSYKITPDSGFGNGNTILHIATNTENPDLDLIIQLIDLNFSISHKNSEGKTPLDFILAYTDNIRAAILPRIGFKLPKAVRGNILLELMKINPIEAHAFLEATPEINLAAKDEKNSSALDLALKAKPINLNFIHHLLLNGAELEKMREDNTTPLSDIIKLNLLNVCGLIIDKHLIGLSNPGLKQIIAYLYQQKAVTLLKQLKAKKLDVLTDHKNESDILHTTINKTPLEKSDITEIAELLEVGYSFTDVGSNLTPVKHLLAHHNIQALEMIIRNFSAKIPEDDLLMAYTEFLWRDHPIIHEMQHWLSINSLDILTHLTTSNHFSLADKYASILNNNSVILLDEKNNKPTTSELALLDVKATNSISPKSNFQITPLATLDATRLLERMLARISKEEIFSPHSILLKILFQFKYRIEAIDKNILSKASLPLLTHYLDSLTPVVIEQLLLIALANKNRGIVEKILALDSTKLKGIALQPIYEALRTLEWKDLQDKLNKVTNSIDSSLKMYLLTTPICDSKVVNNFILEGANPNVLLEPEILLKTPRFIAEFITNHKNQYAADCLAKAFYFAIDKEIHDLIKALESLLDPQTVPADIKSKLFIRQVVDKKSDAAALLSFLKTGIDGFEILPKIDKSYFDLALEKNNITAVKTILLANQSLPSHDDIARAIPCLINSEEDNIKFIINAFMRSTKDSEKADVLKSALLDCIKFTTNMQKIQQLLLSFSQTDHFSLFVNNSVMNLFTPLWRGKYITGAWVDIMNCAWQKMLDLAKRSRDLKFDPTIAAFISWTNQPAIFKSRNLTTEYQQLCAGRSAHDSLKLDAKQ